MDGCNPPDLFYSVVTFDGFGLPYPPISMKRGLYSKNDYHTGTTRYFDIFRFYYPLTPNSR